MIVISFTACEMNKLFLSSFASIYFIPTSKEERDFFPLTKRTGDEASFSFFVSATFRRGRHFIGFITRSLCFKTSQICSLKFLSALLLSLHIIHIFLCFQRERNGKERQRFEIEVTAVLPATHPTTSFPSLSKEETYVKWR